MGKNVSWYKNSYKNLLIIYPNQQFKKWARTFIFHQLPIQSEYWVDQFAFS